MEKVKIGFGQMFRPTANGTFHLGQQHKHFIERRQKINFAFLLKNGL
jgi:hypothetical protein